MKATDADDRELIRRILAGEQALFAELVDRYQAMVFTVAMRYCGTREDAEELAQSAFVKAYQQLAAYRGDAKFSTWLYTIVSSLSLSFLRKRRLDLHSLDDDRVFSAVDRLDGGLSANQLEGKSKVKMVQQAIARLGPADAQVLSLFYQAEQTLEEIGQIMGIDPNTAKVKLHRARGRLKTLLENEYSQEIQDWRN